MNSIQDFSRLIKKLRSITSAGISDCRDALNKTNGNIDEAVLVLRKAGIIKAAKRLQRTTNSGVLSVSTSRDNVSVLEVFSETDFVSRESSFREKACVLSSHLLNYTGKESDFLLSPIGEYSSVKDFIQFLVSVFGENISIGRSKVFSAQNNQCIKTYIHNRFYENKEYSAICGEAVSVMGFNLGSRGLSPDQVLFDNLGKQIGMHIVASAPLCIDRCSVDPDILEKEKSVILESVSSSDKPLGVIEKITQGKFEKFFKNNILLEQSFIMDTSITCGQLIDSFNKENKTSISIDYFYRVNLKEKLA